MSKCRPFPRAKLFNLQFGQPKVLPWEVTFLGLFFNPTFIKLPWGRVRVATSNFNLVVLAVFTFMRNKQTGIQSR